MVQAIAKEAEYLICRSSKGLMPMFACTQLRIKVIFCYA